MLSTTQAITSSISELKAMLGGSLIQPDQLEYDEARLAFNRTVDQHPALIVSAANTYDVALAVQFAREHELGVAVQSTGHGVILPADDAVLILTAGLNALRINPERNTAWVGAGLRWGEVLTAAQKYGLAPLLGSSPGVGVVGYTLGGGMGWLARKYGLAADSVISFEVVTAQGEIVRSSLHENQELYHGLRGGGGSFGVVTGMEIQLYPVQIVYGGNLFYPAAEAHEVLHRYREWIRNAPHELTSSIVLINFPPIPQMPETLRGKSFILVRGCYTGALEDGESMLQFWRDWKQPVIDDFKAMPFSEVARISNDPVNPSPSKMTGAWMHSLSDAGIDALIESTFPQGAPPVITMTEVRHAGGAIRRDHPNASLASQRSAELVLFSVGAAPFPEAARMVELQHNRMKALLTQDLTGAVYMNFVQGVEAHQRTRDGYLPTDFTRLQKLKAATDPENLFRYSYAIAPLTGEKPVD